MPLKRLDPARGVRIVPGGSTVRDGAFLGRGVVCMPPMYINIGAYVGDGTMIDSHALVGSCAQIGQRVHVSAAAQIGGVLEPVGALPVVIEDEVLVGGNCGRLRRRDRQARARCSPSGTILTASTPIYDLPNARIIDPSGRAARSCRKGRWSCRARGRSRPAREANGASSVATPDHREVPRRQNRRRTALEDWIR